MVKKTRKIQVTFGNKTFYTLIALLIVVVVAGVAIAYNKDWVTAPGTPSIMGHTPDEIEGLDDYIRALISESLGLGDCSIRIASTTAADKNVYVPVKMDVSTYKCIIPTGENGCIITLKIKDAKGATVYTQQGTYSQFTDTNSKDKWISTQTPAGGKNGDAVKTPIITYRYIYLYDDVIGQDDTESATKWVLYDNWLGYASELYVCPNI